MPPLLIPVIILEVMYALACVFIGSRPDAPMWLRWPTLFWNGTLFRQRPAPVRPRPDYAKIARLERELGLSDDAPERRRYYANLSTFDRAMLDTMRRRA
ncbi:hypothetical protein ABT010_13570 [Streptomyces sp. NPDC002668]|uniref:hypothetical protein n=1 Tax=Streptomyces sp. NPDC002668 TaxID=3154422 RepID=UPI0033248DE7